jgi:hypothetical protein
MHSYRHRQAGRQAGRQILAEDAMLINKYTNTESLYAYMSNTEQGSGSFAPECIQEDRQTCSMQIWRQGIRNGIACSARADTGITDDNGKCVMTAIGARLIGRVRERLQSGRTHHKKQRKYCGDNPRTQARRKRIKLDFNRRAIKMSTVIVFLVLACLLAANGAFR